MTVEQISSDKYVSFFLKMTQEIARFTGAFIAVLGAIWFLGSPAAEQFITNIINSKHFASQNDVTNIVNRMDRMETTQSSQSQVIENTNAQVKDIKEIATETRATLTQLLLVVKQK